MPKDPFSLVNNIVNEKTLKSAGKFITKIIALIFGFISILLFGGVVTFLIAGLSSSIYFFYIVSIFFLFPAAFLLVLSIKFGKKSTVYDYSKSHYNDIDSCEVTLQKIKVYLKNEKINKSEFEHIYGTMRKELDEAKILAGKIDTISKALNNPDCKITNIDLRIREEKSKDTINQNFINTLIQQKENVIKLESRLHKLKDHVSNLRINFNSVYTKLTLLDTQNNKINDEIETEIQKILDFKLDVAKYEEELLKDI